MIREPERIEVTVYPPAQGGGVNVSCKNWMPLAINARVFTPEDCAAVVADAVRRMVLAALQGRPKRAKV